MNNNDNLNLSACSSAQNLARIKEQQQKLSLQFRLANFVTYGKLDLLSLKSKINSIRNQKNMSKFYKSNQQNSLHHQAQPKWAQKQLKIEQNQEEGKTIDRQEVVQKEILREKKEKCIKKRIHTQIEKPYELKLNSSKQKNKLNTSKSHNNKIKNYANYIKKMSIPKSNNLNKSMELVKQNQPSHESKSQRKLQTNHQIFNKQQSQHQHQIQYKSIHKFPHSENQPQKKQNVSQQPRNAHLLCNYHDHQIKIRSQRTIPKSLIKTISTQQNEQSQYKIHNIGKRQYSISKKIPSQYANHKMTLNPKSKKKTNIIMINNKQQLLKLQNNIQQVWSLYRLLSQITIPLSQNRYSLLTKSPNFQQFIMKLSNYRNMVCSLKYEFLINIVNNCLELYQARTVIVSRIQENLSILYIFLALMRNNNKNQEKQSWEILFSSLVNFVGIASQNLLLLIKLLQLLHNVSTSKPQTYSNTSTGSAPIPPNIFTYNYSYSEKTIKILQTISNFQKQSYLQQISSKKEIVLRIEHNNETINIIQSKLNAILQNQQYDIRSINQFVKVQINQRFNKDNAAVLLIKDGRAQKKKQTLLKTLENDSQKSNPKIKPLFQYSFFIFEYLAYRIHQSNLYNTFNKQVSIAPSPYISFRKEFTIFINAIKVCMKEKQNKIFIRPYTDMLLNYLKTEFNVVFWTELKPNEADDLFDIIQNQNRCTQPIQHRSHYKLGDLERKDIQLGRKWEIKRLYEHHCVGVCTGQEEVWIKDIQRTGCQQNKYLIIDTHTMNYYEKQKDKILLAPWKNNSKDYHLNTILNIIKANSTNLNQIVPSLNPNKSLNHIKSINSYLNSQQKSL